MRVYSPNIAVFIGGFSTFFRRYKGRGSWKILSVFFKYKYRCIWPWRPPWPWYSTLGPLLVNSPLVVFTVIGFNGFNGFNSIFFTQGDSGGPLQLAHSTYSCMYTQIGITSAGKQCAMKDWPGIYTRVSKYLPWIERIVWPKSGWNHHIQMNIALHCTHE